MLGIVGKVPIALVVALVLAGQADAQQLTYTTHVEMRKVEVVPPDNPVLVSLYAQLAATLSNDLLLGASGEAVDFTCVLTDAALRLQVSKPTPVLSEGTAQIIHPDGSALFVNGASKTFWKFAIRPGQRAATAAMLASVKPSVSWRHTGEFTTIAGVRTERVTFKATLDPPGLPRTLLPQGANLEISGEAWLAPGYKAYAALQTRSYAVTLTSIPLLSTMEQDGFVLRIIMRSDMLGGYEVEKTVTSISEGPVAASLFEAPAGYREVYESGPGIQMPKKISDVAPVFPREAQRAGIEGSVVIEAVVTSDGTIRDARVLRSLDAQFGVDQEALSAVKQWQFTPGLLDGAPIDVIIRVQVAFSLRSQAPVSTGQPVTP